MSQSTPQRPTARVAAAPAADAPIQFGVRIGHTVLPPTASIGELRAAIEQSNSRLRLPGLADELDPDIINADKAMALMSTVPALAKKAPKRFAGLELSLKSDGLQIGSAHPTTLASFAMPFKLEIVEVKGKTLLARSTVSVVPQLARERATEAQRQIAIETQRIEPLEAKLRVAPDVGEVKRAILDELTPARWRRSALVRAWRINASRLSEQPGAGVAEKSELEAAEKAVKEYGLLGREGMPGSR